MESQTRKKLQKWSSELDKLDDKTKVKESEIWCLTALSILEQDEDFKRYLENPQINQQIKTKEQEVK